MADQLCFVCGAPNQAGAVPTVGFPCGHSVHVQCFAFLQRANIAACAVCAPQPQQVAQVAQAAPILQQQQLPQPGAGMAPPPYAVPPGGLGGVTPAVAPAPAPAPAAVAPLGVFMFQAAAAAAAAAPPVPAPAPAIPPFRRTGRVSAAVNAADDPDSCSVPIEEFLKPQPGGSVAPDGTILPPPPPPVEGAVATVVPLDIAAAAPAAAAPVAAPPAAPPAVVPMDVAPPNAASIDIVMTLPAVGAAPAPAPAMTAPAPAPALPAPAPAVPVAAPPGGLAPAAVPAPAVPAPAGPVPAVPAAPAEVFPDGAVSVRLLAGLKGQPAGEAAQVPLVIGMKVSSLARTPVDIVIVVDKSGSMSGEKIALAQESIRFVASQLDGRDRMAIVPFSNDGTFFRGLGLVRVNAPRKVSIDAHVGEIRAEGGTTIYSGLRRGIRLLEERRTKNPSAVVMLLTDGEDNQPDELRKRLEGWTPSGYTVHVIGYGSEHDAVMCGEIARRGGGSYAYVRDVDKLGNAVAGLIGFASGLAATAVSATVALQEPTCSRLTPFRALGAVKGEISADRMSARLALPSLVAGIPRDFVFGVELAAGEVAPTRMRFRVEYRRVDGVEFVSKGAIEIARDVAVATPSAHPDVACQLARVEVSEATDAAAQALLAGDGKRALDIVEAAIRAIAARALDAGFRDSLMRKLEKCRKSVRGEADDGAIVTAPSTSQEAYRVLRDTEATQTNQYGIGDSMYSSNAMNCARACYVRIKPPSNAAHK